MDRCPDAGNAVVADLAVDGGFMGAIRSLAEGDGSSVGSVGLVEGDGVDRPRALSSAGRVASGDEASSYELMDKRALADVIRACRRARPPAVVRTTDDASRVGRMLGLDREHDDVSVAIDGDDVPEGPCSARFELHDVLFILHGQLRRRAGKTAISRPMRLYSMDRRSAARTPIPEGRAELVWSSLDTDDPRPSRSSVRDLSPTGVGVVADDESGPLPDSVFPAELRVGSSVVPCLAETKRRATAAGGTSGVRIYAGGLTSGLVETYLSERMPQLVPRSAVPGDVMLRVMSDSGYLHLRDADADFQAWKDFASDEVASCDRVYRAADGTPLGHASATRIYSKTWLLHQLACLRGHPESGECRKVLYLFVATVPTVFDGVEASVVAYFDQELRWHKLFFKRFTEWTNNPSLATICSFDRFERDDPPGDFSPPEGCEVRQARDEELLGTCTLVRAHLPQITADAFDIHPTSVRRVTTTREQRGRHVLVLRQGGNLAGVALCETGDPNASLFNLVNIAQIYLRTGRSAPPPGAQRALVHAVRLFYAARGVQRPLIVSPPGTLDGAAEPGTRLAEKMGCIVVTGRGLRQWENFCRFYFGFLWERQGQNSEGDSE
jgi:hypothetical protein